MNKMLQKIVTKWKYTKSDMDRASVYHNKSNANKMLQQIVTKWTGSNKTNKIKKKGWLSGGVMVRYLKIERESVEVRTGMNA
jgi:hypothetical protein